MSYSIETVQLEAKSYVGVRSTVGRDQIADTIAESFGKTWNWLSEQGIAPAGMPMSIYHHVDHVAGQYEIQPSLVVAEAIDGQDDITSGSTPAGPALTTTHTGSYEGLGDAWMAIFAHAEENGLVPSSSPWEEYIDDPGEVEPAKLRTQVFLPV